MLHPLKGFVFPVFLLPPLCPTPGDPSLLRRASHSPLRGAGVSGLAQLPTLAVSPGVPRSRASPRLPVHLAALLLTETSFCRRPNLPCRPGRPSRGHPPPRPRRRRKIYCLWEQMAPALRWGAAVGPRGPGPRVATPGRVAKPPGSRDCSFTHANIHAPKADFFFFPLPPSSTILPPPMLFFTSAFVCHWQESKLLFLLPLRFKWSWQIKPS